MWENKIMNGRKLFREYAQSKGKEAVSFVKIEIEGYGYGDHLYTKDSDGNTERTHLGYEDMVHWIIKTKKFKEV